MTNVQAGLGELNSKRNTLMLQMPTREDVLNLVVGDAIHGPLGPSEVVSIHGRGFDADGLAFVCYYLYNGPDSTVSDSMKEDRIERSVRSSNHFTSAELDAIERREIERRRKAKKEVQAA